MSHVLIVDDEVNLRRVLGSLLAGDGHEVAEAAGAAEARALLAAARFDVVITDQKMPDGDGLGLLRACQDVDATLPVVMMTAFASVELAVDAMRAGAFDFVSKPFQPEVVRATVRRAADRAALQRENERLRGEVRRLAGEEEILGDGPALHALRDTLARVAPTDATVLIMGETGTGKELVARAIHAASRRAAGPFVAVNCAAFTETLLESELFGHERGAFTGADRTRLGLFEAAHRGTLFLDEAAEMSLPLQARLLRVLADGRIVRVGSTTPRSVDVRVLVATHRDLQVETAAGRFREDLYYRLAVVPLAIPPLRERRADVPALVAHFMARAAIELKVAPRRIDPDAIARLMAYDFPGNVRELRNLVERAMILARGDALGPEDFPIPAADAAHAAGRHGSGAGAGNGAGGTAVGHGAGGTGTGWVPDAPRDSWIRALPRGIDLRATLETLERDLLLRALDAAGGVQAEAARQLGLSRGDIGYRLRKYGIDPPA